MRDEVIQSYKLIILGYANISWCFETSLNPDLMSCIAKNNIMTWNLKATC